MSAPAVAAAGVWKYFGDYPALRDVRFELPAGECLALLGRNGAGKTTLLRILGGLSGVSKGEVRIEGGEVRASATRARIGWLGHSIGLYDELSARENLRTFGALYSVTPRMVADWIERVNLSHVADAPVREYSRGMRQRLAVARAFLHGPRILLLDEPFTSLDDKAIALLQSLLAQARAEGRTIILSTHQIREAMELASKVALLDRGKLIHFGERTAEMATDPGYLYRTYGSAA
ncbi:MAG TPA: heme ABC exporter ATP-binding protein CcmA [Bryobacteraceae bacterium]|nr:heme ABC exporter ATP-binding protein CcmA [Bryobacteraceae bacterium]